MLRTDELFELASVNHYLRQLIGYSEESPRLWEKALMQLGLTIPLPVHASPFLMYRDVFRFHHWILHRDIR